MNSHKAVIVILSFMTALAVPAGYWLGSRNAQSVFENMNFLLNSERNLAIVDNLKVLEALRENQVDVAIKFTQARVAGGMKYEGIKASSLTRAREYQRKYCEGPCLDVP
jgi:hypothetical protein